MTRKAVAASLLLALAACGGAPAEDTADGESDLSGSCGSHDLGDAVYRAVSTHGSTVGPKTVDGVQIGFDSYANDVKGPFLGGGKHHELVDEMVGIIDGAKHEVFLQALTIEDSWVARRVLDALARAGDRGVQVFVMATPLTSQGTFKQSEDGGFTIVRIASLFGRNVKNVHIGAWKIKGAGAFFSWGLGVLHAKSIVVDGERGLVMTANLERATDPTDVKDGIGWFQMGMRIEGRAAAELRAEAASAWSNADTAPDDVRLPPQPKPTQAKGCAHAIVLGRDATADSSSSADQGFLALFGAARSLNILTPDFNSSVVLRGDTYDGKRVYGLAEATKHAKLRILLPYRFDQSGLTSAGQGGSNQQAANWLVKNAANRCNVHVRWFVNEEGVRTEGNAKFASHAKLTSADGKLVVLGSQNMDTQAWQESRELSVAVDDEPTTKRFDAVFDTLWERAGKHPKGIGYEPDAHCHDEPKNDWVLENAASE